MQEVGGSIPPGSTTLKGLAKPFQARLFPARRHPRLRALTNARPVAYPDRGGLFRQRHGTLVVRRSGAV